MNKDTKQPADGALQPDEQETGEQQTANSPAVQEESSARPEDTEADACEAYGSDEDEYEEELYEEEDWEDEDAPLSLGARLFSASTSLLRWIVLVAVLLALILGGTFFSMYRSVSLNSLPQYDVSWAGQTLEAAGYDWSVPVMGFLHRDFSKKPGSSWQDLEPVSESHPSLELPEYTTALLTIENEVGETLFEGDTTAYNEFHFSENGAYSVTLTVTSPETTGAAQGSYTYQFNFQLEAQPRLVLSATGVAQGSVIGVRLEGVLGDMAPSLTTELAELPFTLYQGEWGAFVPVDYNQMAGSYDISATVNGQTVTETVQVYGRQRRELDTYTIDGTSAIPYVGALPGNMDFL